MIFKRAALREFTATAVAVFVALFFILVTVILVRLLSQAAGGRLPPDAVLALIGFSTLNHLPVVLALSSFIAVLLTLSRSYRDSEMVVWFSSGLSLLAWIRPVLQFMLPLVALVAALSLFLSPWAQGKAQEYRKRLEGRDEVSRVAPGSFRESSGGRRVFFVESVDPAQGRVHKVFIHSVAPDKQDVTVASEGFMETKPNGDRFVTLADGRRYEGTPGTASYRVMEFERYSVRIEPREVGAAESTPKTQSTASLLLMPGAASSGELVWRLGLPLATLILALLAIPLAFVNPRGGRTNNLVFAILAFSIYFNFLGISQSWVSKGRLGVWSGGLGIHLVMLLLLLVLFLWRMRPHLRFNR
ncbi:MAG: LPS export ABC transporter permease LptF [Candidatus Dactylopiibacterium carminicum]|uniref:Lipopolysaccharide export system permease protein LptF n=1 Tax=Candidatus Dactylopiibacterium carminicum TaxID=857335 RepID=A0A272F0E1_9RHOO|nr:LPS export ABC transporter permease LptF [Candidatus Dactylopiibacterium carminicum]KAF7600841.1 LPS export ABC transporter permease LptF [Candidatus Dactylopiibacterium carminicum]PAS95340.1 MAG: LPS export ABC transporter permease LptF [Candidatus Dactylopiibacterium carminicum]PAS98648.1 MAG: LPS export ABC transporter permease LptF [Candidatus Dactylopiibacterium carminicum]PAT00845.1 MAG: LPS export ABC transporter permease LptF [Candidatus Dactylopiibacterium carminicum]